MSVARLFLVHDDESDSEATGDASAETSSATQTVSGLYDEHRNLVFGIALRYGRGDRSWAEDVTQDVFLSLFRGQDRLDAIEDAAAWLYRLTTNRCISKLKREARRRHLLFWSARGRSLEAPSPEQVTAIGDQLRRALELVEGLDPEARACFYMHHVDGLPQKEIAAILGRSPSTVCRVLARIQKRLQAVEKEHAGE